MSEQTVPLPTPCPMCGVPDPDRAHEQRVTESVTLWHCKSELIQSSPKEPRELLRRKSV